MTRASRAGARRLVLLAVAVFAPGCGEKSNAGYSGTAGSAGGAAGGGGGEAGAAGRGGQGGSGGVGGGGGGTGGTGGTGTTCAEPAPCDGYDNRPDANITAAITCLSPGVAPAGAPLALAIYGHHLATGPTANAIVTLDSGAPLNGIPQSACHIDVQIPANQLAVARQATVVVSPGGWTLSSLPATLTVR